MRWLRCVVRLVVYMSIRSKPYRHLGTEDGRNPRHERPWRDGGADSVLGWEDVQPCVNTLHTSNHHSFSDHFEGDSRPYMVLDGSDVPFGVGDVIVCRGGIEGNAYGGKLVA